MKTIQDFLEGQGKAVFFDGKIQGIISGGLETIIQTFKAVKPKHGYVLYRDEQGCYFYAMSHDGFRVFNPVERDNITTLYRMECRPDGIFNVANSPHYTARRRWRDGVALIVVYDKLGMELGHCEAKKMKEHLEKLHESNYYEYRNLLEQKYNADLIRVLAVEAEGREVVASSVEDFLNRYRLNPINPQHLQSFLNDFAEKGFLDIPPYFSVTDERIYWCGNTEPFTTECNASALPPTEPAKPTTPTIKRRAAGNLFAQMVA